MTPPPATPAGGPVVPPALPVIPPPPGGTPSVPGPVPAPEGTDSESTPPPAPNAGPVAFVPLPAKPSVVDIIGFPGFPEPLQPVGEVGEDDGTDALGGAINVWVARDVADDFSALEGFVANYKDSAWTPAIQYNLGRLYYHTGYFSKAIATYEAVWDACRRRKEVRGQAIAMQAASELALMYARTGRKGELMALLAQSKDHKFADHTKVKNDQASEGLAVMKALPGISFRCGTFALANVCRKLGKAVPADFLDSHPSTEQGFTLAQLREFAGTDLDFPTTAIRRTAGSAVPVPSVIHLRCGHYGAILESVNGRFRLSDPTFGNETWMSLRAIEEEGSGYFLVPAATVAAGLAEIDVKEAGKIAGKGYVAAIDPRSTTAGDHKTKKKCPPAGMASYTFHTLAASLSVSDTPLVIPTAYGPGLSLNVTYNQREAELLGTKTYTHFGPQWVCELASWLMDDSTYDPAPVTIYVPGGGSEVHSTYTQTGVGQGFYAIERKSQSRLYRIAPGSYERRSADGSKLVFSRAIGTGNSRQVFLSQVVDSWGNALSWTYDTSYLARVTAVTAASGQALYFFYGNATDVYLVTGAANGPVFANASRKATFAYVTAGTQQRLTSITDPVGIVSSFGYDATGFMTSLTTPYGTTTFATNPTAGDGTTAPLRWLESTDANGDKERVEYYHRVLALTGSIPATNVPTGTGVSTETATNEFYNSFHWDKKAWGEAPGDRSKAHRYRWLHSIPYTTGAYGVLEMEKPAYENHVWYNYPGQSISYYPGTISSPSAVSRLIEGPTGANASQIQRFEYHASTGNLTKSTDPDGRVVRHNYDTTGYDLLSTEVQDGAAWLPLVTYSGYVNHRPQTVTDASGIATTVTYNSKGQPLTVTRGAGANAQTARYTYNQPDGAATKGFPILIEHSAPGNPAAFVPQATLTYDALGRVLDSTDSDGYTLTYAFDGLDRPTLVTHPDGTTEQTIYTQGAAKLIQPTGFKDRAGRWKYTHYNSLGQPDSTTDAENRITQYAWCRCGDLWKLIDPMNKLTEWKHDAQGRVYEKILSDGKKHSYTYQPLSGRLSTVAFPNDTSATPARTTFTNTYSLSGQLIKKNYTAPAMADVTFSYLAGATPDPLARLRSMVDGLGTTTYSYVALGGTTPAMGAGRVASVNGPLAHDTLRYGYDALARLYKREVVKDDGTTVTRTEQVTFDGLDRPSQLVNDLGTFGYTFAATNLTGTPDSITRPGGLSTVLTRFPANAGANALRLAGIEHRNAGGSVWQAHGYTYNLAGEIVSWTQPLRHWDLTHDLTGQLTGLHVRADGERDA